MTPYILPSQRDKLDWAIDEVITLLREKSDDEIEGSLNYTLSRIGAGAMKPHTGWRYRYLNRLYGTYQSVATEFYRRVIAPYEDRAILENGDIPEYLESFRE